MTERYKPISFDKWGRGLVTTQEANDIPMNAGVVCQNLDISSGSGIGPRLGRTLWGNRTTTVGKIAGLYTLKTREGLERAVRVRTTLLEYYDSVNDTWNLLKSGLTTNLTAGFAPFNTSSANALYISNGTDNYTKWNGAVTHLNGALSGSEGTITVDSTSEFTTTGTLIIGTTVSVTYTGKTSTTFTGCSNAPAALDNAGVTQLTSEPSLTGATNPLGSILFSADVNSGSRMWIGKLSTMIGSKTANAENFASSSPRIPNEGVLQDFVIGGGKITAITGGDGVIIVFQEDAIVLFELVQQNVSTDEYVFLSPLMIGTREGCVSQKGIAGSRHGTFYISQKGLMVLRREASASLQSMKPTFLFDDIRPTTEGYVFDSDSCIGIWDEKVHVSCKSDSDQSTNDRVVVYDVRTGGLVIYKGWYINQFTIFGNEFYGASSADQNCYKLYDSYADDGGEITSIWRTRQNDFEISPKEKELYTLYMEGLISSGTTLNLTLRYDEQGIRKTVTTSIDGLESNPYIFSSSDPNTLGSNELGTEPLAGTVAGASELNKFRVYWDLAVDTLYNFDLTIQSGSAGARYKILEYAPHVASKETIPAHLKI